MKYITTLLFLVFWAFIAACENTVETIERAPKEEIKPILAEDKNSAPVQESTCAEQKQSYISWLGDFFAESKSKEEQLFSNLDLLWYEGEELQNEVPIITIDNRNMSLYTDNRQVYSVDLQIFLLQDASYIGTSSEVNRLLRQLKELSKPERKQVALAVTTNAPVHVLSALLQRLKVDQQVGFVFSSPLIKAPELYPKEGLGEDIDARVAQLETVWAGCPDGLKQQLQLSVLSSSQRDPAKPAEITALLTAISSALEQCQCNVDISVIKAQNYSLLGRLKSKKSVVWVSFSQEGFMIDPKQTWLENGERMVEGFRNGMNRISLGDIESPPPPPPRPSKKD